MLYWLERYDEQKNITKTILTFKSYISNENSGGSDGGARPLPVRTHRHVAEPPLAGGRRKKMGLVTEAPAHGPSAHADAWWSPPPARGRRKKMGVVRHPPTARQHTLTRG